MRLRAFLFRYFLSSIVIIFTIHAATYYVDYTNGDDTRTTTQAQNKSTPWQTAPGMIGSTGTQCCVPGGFTPSAGDQIILKGCVTWPNAALPWVVYGFTGSAGNLIYFGVDQTWWDSTVSGCSTTWNRPILDAQGMDLSRATRPGYEWLLDARATSYVRFDNIEIKGQVGYPTSVGGGPAAIELTAGGSGSTNDRFTNLYIHGWVNPYFCFGTGNVAANSSTITNFVPTGGQCNANWPTGYAGIPVQIYPQGSYWPVQGGGPTVSSITGTNPYTINTNSSTVGSACNSCFVMVGADSQQIFSGDTNGGNAGTSVETSVIDASDVFPVTLNPNGDCGVMASNNNVCLGSGVAEWRGPPIWKNNVIRFMSSVAVGSYSEISGNLVEYSGRPGADPTGHTNVWESVGNDATVAVVYNNVIHGMETANASAPGGQATSGWSFTTCSPSGGNTYMFNNLYYDGVNTQTQFGLDQSVNCSTTGGHLTAFNNTVIGGPDWSRTYGAFGCPSGGTQYCASENNHMITTQANQSALVGNIGTTTDLPKTPAQATASGYVQSGTYFYSTQPGGYTIAAGTNASSTCTTISSGNATAGTACLSDTTYGVTWNTSTHQVNGAARTAVTHPSTWGVGAFELSTSISFCTLTLLGVGGC